MADFSLFMTPNIFMTPNTDSVLDTSPSTTAPPKKRFIAGAVCPKCKSMDTIRVFRLGDTDHRECVHCDFTDKIRLQSTPNELETRVNVPQEQKQDHVQVVQILTPKPKS